MGMARRVIGSIRGAAMRTRGLPKLPVAAALILALAVVPVRDGAALAQSSQPANGQPYEQRRALKLESSGPRQAGPLSAVQERVLKGERLGPDPAGAKRQKEAAAKAGRASRGDPADSPSLE